MHASPVTSALRCVTCYVLQIQGSKKEDITTSRYKMVQLYTLLPVLVNGNCRDIMVWVCSSMLLTDLCVNMILLEDF